MPPSIICPREPCSLLEIFPYVERSVFIFVNEFLGFFPSLSSGIRGRIFGGGGEEDRRVFPGAPAAEAGEHVGMLPLQLLGIGVRNQEGLFLAFDASQDLEGLPGPCVWPPHGEEEEEEERWVLPPERLWLVLLGGQEDGWREASFCFLVISQNLGKPGLELCGEEAAP